MSCRTEGLAESSGMHIMLLSGHTEFAASLQQRRTCCSASLLPAHDQAHVGRWLKIGHAALYDWQSTPHDALRLVWMHDLLSRILYWLIQYTVQQQSRFRGQHLLHKHCTLSEQIITSHALLMSFPLLPHSLASIPKLLRCCRLPFEASREMQELIDDCTEHNPSMRPDADTIVARLDYLSSASHTFGLGEDRSPDMWQATSVLSPAALVLQCEQKCDMALTQFAFCQQHAPCSASMAASSCRMYT